MRGVSMIHILRSARSGVWKFIRPVVSAVDWILESVFGSHKRTTNDPDIEAGRFESEVRGGPPNTHMGGGMGPSL